MRRPCRDAAQVGEIDDCSFASASSSPRDTCRPLDRHDPSKHGLFCYPDRRGVRFIAGVAAARDDERRCVAGLCLVILNGVGGAGAPWRSRRRRAG